MTDTQRRLGPLGLAVFVGLLILIGTPEGSDDAKMIGLMLAGGGVVGLLLTFAQKPVSRD